MTTLEETGAIDWLLIEAPGRALNGDLVPPLLDLVDRRLIRVLDCLVLVKRGDADFDAFTTDELDATQVGDIGELRGAVGLAVRRRCGDRRRAAARQHRAADRV